MNLEVLDMEMTNAPRWVVVKIHNGVLNSPTFRISSFLLLRLIDRKGFAIARTIEQPQVLQEVLGLLAADKQKGLIGSFDDDRFLSHLTTHYNQHFRSTQKTTPGYGLVTR